MLGFEPAIGYPLMQVPRRGDLANQHKAYEAHYKQKRTWHEQQQAAGNLYEQGAQEYQEE